MRPALRTRRLLVAPVTEQELPRLLAVYASNPGYLEMTEGPAGYDLPRLQRDWHLAAISPGRRMWAMYRRGDPAPVGVVDFLDPNPQDGYPWIGLLMVRADCQRQGYGTEALEGLLRHGRQRLGWRAVRIGVLAANGAALAWWQRRGFRAYGRKTLRFAAGELEVILLERRLQAGSP